MVGVQILEIYIGRYYIFRWEKFINNLLYALVESYVIYYVVFASIKYKKIFIIDEFPINSEFQLKLFLS